MRQGSGNINELEEFVVNSYQPEMINSEPKTEKELLFIYQKYTVPLYDYMRHIFQFVYPISNEIRAMLGHLSEYRTLKKDNRRELEKAYGHFRRINLDAFKIICNELDRSLFLVLQKQYSYDYRNICVDYLKIYGEKYFSARKAYLYAQEEESVGIDSYTHNIFDLYYQAAKQYILLKQFYEKYKKEIKKEKCKTNTRKIVCGCISAFGIIVTFIGLIL